VGLGWPAQRGLRGTAFAASVALPAVLVFWLPSGPLGANWARRAGTPVSALTRGATTSSTPSSTPGQTSITAFSAGVNGTLRQTQGANGLVDVNISLAAVPALALTIAGNAVPGGGVQMTSSTVALGGSRDPTRFTGSITSLSGTNIAANVSSADGRTLALVLALNIDSSNGSVTGTLQASPNQ
jgi:hypothetical protein